MRSRKDFWITKKVEGEYLKEVFLKDQKKASLGDQNGEYTGYLESFRRKVCQKMWFTTHEKVFFLDDSKYKIFYQ